MSSFQNFFDILLIWFVYVKPLHSVFYVLSLVHLYLAVSRDMVFPWGSKFVFGIAMSLMYILVLYHSVLQIIGIEYQDYLKDN